MAELPERKMKRKFKPVPEVSRHDRNVDPFMAILAREQRAREKMVAIAEMQILAERVKECYMKEGVNHFKNCEKHARAYLKRIQEADYKDAPVEMTDVE